MAKTKRHIHYDKAEARTLSRSALPRAIMASPGTHFDSAEEASVFLPVSLITSRLVPMMLNIPK